jgi:hypothetical protein
MPVTPRESVIPEVPRLGHKHGRGNIQRHKRTKYQTFGILGLCKVWHFPHCSLANKAGYHGRIDDKGEVVGKIATSKSNL